MRRARRGALHRVLRLPQGHVHGRPLIIREESLGDALDDHARIPIRFLVERRLEVSLVDGGLGGVVFRERSVEVPYEKDYDASESPGQWPERFDMANWALLAAHEDGRRIGGAVVAFRTPGVDVLGGRTDLAVLWDVRVPPDARRRGVGSELFRAAEEWARARSCRTLQVETQNVNLAACRFYASRGCTLGRVDRFAYPGLPGETQLLWRKTL